MFSGDDLDLQTVLADMAANEVILFAVVAGSSVKDYWDHWTSLTGGEALLLNNSSNLPDAIQTIIENSAAKVDHLSLRVTPGFESWVAIAPASYTNLTTPAEVTFNLVITVPGGTPPGDYEFTVTAIGDGASFGQQTVLLHVLPLDENPPVTTLSLSGSTGNLGWWRSPTVMATLTATDDLSGVGATYYSVDGGALALYTGAFPVTGEGSHSIGYFSVDNVGNVEAPSSATLAIDSVAPAVALSSTGDVGDNGWYVSPVTVTAAAADADPGSGVAGLFLDVGSGFGPYAGVVVLGEGVHVVQAYAEDVAGNASGVESQLAGVDLTAPVITAAALAPEYMEGDPVAITFTAADGVSGLASLGATLNGAPVASGDSVTLVAGYYTLEITARDMAGHEAVEVQTFVVKAPGEIHAHPRTLNLKSHGWSFTVHINFDDGRVPADIDCSSILLNGVVPADCSHPGSGDEMGHGHGRLFHFERSLVQAIAVPGNWTVVITGNLADGTPFVGSDTIRVIH